jgi:hypothetical protein
VPARRLCWPPEPEEQDNAGGCRVVFILAGIVLALMLFGGADVGSTIRDFMTPTISKLLERF